MIYLNIDIAMRVKEEFQRCSKSDMAHSERFGSDGKYDAPFEVYRSDYASLTKVWVSR